MMRAALRFHQNSEIPNYRAQSSDLSNVTVPLTNHSSTQAGKHDPPRNNVHHEVRFPNIENVWNTDKPEIDEWHQRDYGPVKRM